jgi:hypothetical protein
MNTMEGTANMAVGLYYKLTASQLFALPEFSFTKRMWDLVCAMIQMDIAAYMICVV